MTLHGASGDAAQEPQLRRDNLSSAQQLKDTTKLVFMEEQKEGNQKESSLLFDPGHVGTHIKPVSSECLPRTVFKTHYSTAKT